MLDIVANYHRMQFHSKNMIQIQANGEKPDFGPDLGPLNPNSGFQFFFSKDLKAIYVLLPMLKRMQIIYVK